MSEKLTEEVLQRMKDLNLKKQYIDDPDWTTQRGLALIEEVRQLRLFQEKTLSFMQEMVDEWKKDGDLLPAFILEAILVVIKGLKDAANLRP